ncbi:MAG: tripartite tricarboxylate transporter TctB family protein [Thermodesulfobacteriota bacterium]
MNQRANIALLFWIALGIFISIHSYRLGLGTWSSPGPGLMPFLVGALLSAFSLFSLVRRLRQKSGAAMAGEKRRRPELGRICLVLGSIIGYAFLLERLGYLVTSFLMLALLFRGMGTTRYGVAATLSAATVLVTYLVFSYLGVAFPPGILQWKGFPG